MSEPRFYSADDVLNVFAAVSHNMSLGSSVIEEFVQELARKQPRDLVSRGEYNDVKGRLDHLLKSDYIASFDRIDFMTGGHARDIHEADAERMKLSMNLYNKATRYTNCIVEVLENSMTGEISVGWYRTDETEEINDI